MPNDIFYSNVDLYKRGLFDFMGWIDYDTGEEFTFHKKQIRALEMLNDDTTGNPGYGGAARGGKSLLICADGLFSCYAYPGITNLLGRKKLQNLFDTTWRTMGQLYRSFEFKVGNEPTADCNAPSLYNKNVFYKEVGSTIMLKNLVYEPSDPEMSDFGSMEIYKAYIDQSEQIDIRVIDKVSERKGTHRLCAEYGVQGKKLEVFNPSKNHVNTRYWIPFRDGKESDTRKFVRALPTDNPARAAQVWVSEKETEYRNGDMSEVDYQKQILGNFDYDDDPSTLIDYQKSLAIFENKHVLNSGTGKRFITCDVALRGSDKAVFMVWEGFTIIHCESHAETSGKDVLDIIKRLKDKYLVLSKNIVFDADGVGGGLSGHIRGAFEFHNGAKAVYDQNYQNLKTQCYYILTDFVNNNWVYFNTYLDEETKQEIIEELAQVKEKHGDKDGKLQLIGKDEVKKNIGRSPDYSDAMAMRMVFELRDASTTMKLKKEAYRKYWLEAA